MTNKTQTKSKTASNSKEAVIETKNPLRPGVFILVKPVIRPNYLLPEGHSGNWLYDNTGMSFTARLNPDTGQIVEPLTKEERLFFENSNYVSEHGLDYGPGDLSARKTENNFWETFKVKVVKKAKGPLSPDSVIMRLDLGDPHDYFRYAVLKTWDGPGGKVAVGLDNKFSRGSNRIVLVEQGEEYKTSVETVNKEETVNKFFYSINHSAEEMRDFLKAYNLTYRADVDVPTDGSVDWFKIEIRKLISSNTDKVLALIEDRLYKDKVFIVKALKHGFIKIDRNKNFSTENNEPLGQTLVEVIENLNKDEFQELLLHIKAKLDK